MRSICRTSEGTSQPRKLTNRNKGFGYALFWSPDSKKLAFIDETNDISIIDVGTGEVVVADNTDWNIGHGGRYGYSIAWSPDSRWIAYSKGLDNANNAIFLYNLEKKQSSQATSGFYEDLDPVFSTDGKYLFYLTNRSLTATYSDMGDGTWIYPNSTQIASLSLTKKTPSLLLPKNDEIKKEEKKGEEDKAEEKAGEKEAKDAKPPKDTAVSVEVDFDNLEARLVLSAARGGQYRRIDTF